MRYSRQHQQETRDRLRLGASRAFRTHGYAGVGVDAIAGEAGATAGAFYANFESKHGAFQYAVEFGMDELLQGVRRFKATHADHWFHEFVGWYLGPKHRKDIACGCALATLTPDVTRADAATKHTFETIFAAIVDEVADGLKGGSLEDRRQRARGVLALLSGAVTVSRAMANEQVAGAIAQAALAMALQASPKTSTNSRAAPNGRESAIS